MRDMLLSEIIQNCKERKTCDGCEFKAHSVRSCILGYQPSMWNLHIEIDDTPMFGKWIPCSERLPDFGWYITSADTGNNTHVGMHLYTGEEWECEYTVKAWMPLPESFKEENE